VLLSDALKTSARKYQVQRAHDGDAVERVGCAVGVDV
jgi:hypothetical protein